MWVDVGKVYIRVQTVSAGRHSRLVCGLELKRFTYVCGHQCLRIGTRDVCG